MITNKFDIKLLLYAIAGLTIGTILKYLFDFPLWGGIMAFIIAIILVFGYNYYQQIK